MKKVPLRKCVATQEQLPKKELIRVVRSKEGEIFVDPTGKKNGRGAYICHSVTCFEKAKRSKALEKSLRISIPFDVYDELEKELSESEGR